MKKLSEKTEKLLEEFDAAAQSWGWQSDQGSIRKKESEREYNETKKALVKQIQYLEQKIKHLQAKNF